MALLLVDMDDTLVDREATFVRWREKHLPNPRHRLWARVNRRVELHRPVSRLSALFERAEPRSYRLEEGVADALAAIRQAGWKIALITNGSRRTQPAKIRSAGIEPLVDAVVISSHEGFAKPDPRVFRLAAHRSGSTLEGAWVIGDDLSQEIACSHNLGLRSVWLNPRGRPGNGDVDLEASSFPEAVALILGEPPPGPPGRPAPPGPGRPRPPR